MGKKKPPPKPTGGLDQNGVEKRLCNCICICQLVSIISFCAMLYLSVIVVVPAKRTLEAQYVLPSVVCTTTRVDKAGDCKQPSCSEWCMSKGGSNCPVVYAKVRHRGATVRFRQCTGMKSSFCSAQRYEETQSFVCAEQDPKDEKRGQCDKLNKFMECSPTRLEKKLDGLQTNRTSICRNITAIRDCKDGTANPAPFIVTCSLYACNELEGIYDCANGNCRVVKDPICTDRCTSLDMGNIGIMTPDLFRWGSCERADVNGTEVWTDANKPLALYCTRVTESADSSELVGEDCMNGTLAEPDRFSDITNYTQILALLRENGEQLDVTQTVLPSETALLISNDTKVMINIEGCVNTLQQDCQRWRLEKERDGSDGMHQAVYPCYTTPTDSDYVITDYDHRQTVFQLLLAAVIPSSLLILSCTCLILFGKTVGVNEFGLFFCKPCHKRDGAGADKPPSLDAL